MAGKRRIDLPKGGFFYTPDRKRFRPMVRAKSMVEGALGELCFASGEALEELSQRWEEAVGEETSLHCYPVALRGTTLELAVDSSAWCQQLQYQKKDILRGVQRILGDRSPEELLFLLG
ncbi:MAG: DUF721 domain-containing protein [Deltaproteobacteria bacterium]|nr:DUF721 domain-containing protein [Deltaproteobacteria bacterium]